ncbi:MAG: NYN domain-containing protein [Acidimicrobiales bacterium]
MHWVVDGMNLIGSRPDGWWRDRPGARRRLVSDLGTLVGPEVEVTVVFDGRPGAGEIEAAAALDITARFAPGGPNAADHAIVALLESIGDRAGITVVTSDRPLADAVRRAGVTVEGVGTFRARLPEDETHPPGHRRGHPHRPDP